MPVGAKEGGSNLGIAQAGRLTLVSRICSGF
jgi:hypothetical protein